MTGDIVAIRIAPEGWYAEFEIEGFSIGAAYDFALQDITVPTGRTPYFIVVSEGYDPQGVPVTVTRKIHATIQQRKPDPNDSQNQESVTNGRLLFQAVLSEFVYNDDKNGGTGTSGVDPVFYAPAGWVHSGGTPSKPLVAGSVTNLSTLDYPVPIANWTRPDHARLDGFSVTTAAIGFHASGRDGKPLACIEFTATSGAQSSSVLVAEPRIDSDLADAHPVIEYIGTLDLSGFTDNSRVAVNFKAYPLIGDEDAVYDSTAGSATAAVNHHTFPQSYLLDVAGARGYPIAVVNPASGTAAGSVLGLDTEGNRALAAVAPYKTLAQAMAGISAYLGEVHGRNDLSGATVYLDAGIHRTAGGSEANAVPVTDGDCWFTIKPLPGVLNAVLIPDAGNNLRLAAHAIKFENCVFERGLNKPFAAGNSGRLLTLACDLRDTRATTSSEEIFDNPGTQWHVRSKFRRVQLYTSYFRGCSFPEGDRLGRRCFIVGCDWSRYGSPSKTFLPSTEPSNTSDGMVMAFNAFWDCNKGIAEYPGISEGTFLQGCAVVQNVFEQAKGEGERLMRLAGDGNENVTNNCVIAHNTAVGELSNFFYNDESGPRHLHNGHVIVLNAMRSLGSKGDVFSGDSRSTGNWPVYNGCGLQGNRVEGGNFPTRFRGIHSIAGAGNPGDATFLSLGFINDASASGTESGHGNYRPAMGSILNAVAGPRMVRWDFEGLERLASDSAGAYRFDPSGFPPAPPASLRLTSHAVVLAEDFEGGQEPEGWTHDASGFNYGYTVSPLRGSRSLWIGGNSSPDTLRGVYTPVPGGFPRFGEVWSVYMVLKILAMPVGGSCRFLSVRRALDKLPQSFLTVDPGGRLSAGSLLNTGSSGFYSMAVGAETHLWLRGNPDGSLTGWAAPTALKPPEVVFASNGANLGKTGSLQIGGMRSIQILVDHLRIRTGEIGSDPE